MDGGWSVESSASEPEVRTFLGLDQKGQATNEWLAQTDPARVEVFLSPVVRGLRLLRPSCPVETLFCFLCTSNNHISRITKMVASLAEFGEGHRFPKLDRIASISEEELRRRGFGYRAKTIPIAAAQILDRGGLDWLEGLKSGSYEDARTGLLALAGVGPKLADCIALFALHHGEAVPIDVHMWRAAVRHYRPDWAGQALTARRYMEVGNELRTRFGDRAGAAHHFLFVHQLRMGSGNLKP